MPLHSISPFDPVDDEEDIDAWLTKHMSPLAAKPACRCFDWRTAACDYAAIMILSTRFAVSSFVIVLGAPLFLYFVIAGWNLPTQLPGSVGYLMLPALFTIAAGSMLTAPLGARVAHGLDITQFKRVFALLLFGLAGYMAWHGLSA